MIVARQFTAWEPHYRIRPSTGRVFFLHPPGNKLPGYDQSVPPGQKHPHGIRFLDSTSLLLKSTTTRNDVTQSNPGGFKFRTLESAW